MGISCMGSSCSCDDSKPEKPAEVLPNPNPRNFTRQGTCQVGSYLILQVKYPDCTNYEGQKILVYADVSIQQLRDLVSIDPHFCDSEDHPSPVARFEPTIRGWDMARKLCFLLSGLKNERATNAKVLELAQKTGLKLGYPERRP